MTRAPTRRSSSRAGPEITLRLSRTDVDTLIAVARHYELVLGVMRHLVILTSPRSVRQKYRYIVAESAALLEQAEAVRDRMDADGRAEASARVSVHFVIAFWGRLLSNLASRRSRRKLKPVDIERREALIGTLEAAARELWQRNEAAVRAEIDTRRTTERGWMLAALVPSS